MGNIFINDDVGKLLNCSDIDSFLSNLMDMPRNGVFDENHMELIAEKVLTLLENTSDSDLNKNKKLNLALENILMRSSLKGLLNLHNFWSTSYISPGKWGDIINLHRKTIIDNDNISERLFSSKSYLTIGFLDGVVAPEDLKHILLVAIKNACKKADMEQLIFFEKKYPQQFMEAIQDDYLKEFKDFLTLSVSRKFPEIFRSIGQYNKLGELDYNGLLALCASMHETKSYFTPVILNCEDDASQLIDLLKYVKENIDFFDNKAEPIVFIIKSFHTISGSIKINNGKVTLSFLDSLGKQSFNGIEWGETTTKEVLNLAKEIFGENNLYVVTPDPKRQYSSAGCTVFATNDAMNLFKHPISFGGLPLPLPLPFLKSLQSSVKMEEVKERFPYNLKSLREQKLNKKQQTFSESQKENFIFDKNLEKVINQYIENKLPKWRKKVMDFFKSNSDAEVAQKINFFTLEGFKNRIFDTPDNIKHKRPNT